MKSTGNYSDEIKRLKKAIEEAYAIVIGAGAGLSTSAGFVYNGERFRWRKIVGIIALSDVLRPEAADVALMTDDIARWTDREVKVGKPPHLCTASEVF